MINDKRLLELIISFAEDNENVRAVILNGSRVNPEVTPDRFQDFDIQFIVNDVQWFISNRDWINVFGNTLIIQTPDTMFNSKYEMGTPFAYLIQFSEGHRIDLTLFPAEQIEKLSHDSLSKTLLDKDNILPIFPPPSDSDYLPEPPTGKELHDTINEFYWVMLYAVKGLCRKEKTYALEMRDRIIRPQLMKMIVWYLGYSNDFKVNPGKCGKFLKKHLDEELWKKLLTTYSNSEPENIENSLFNMMELFRILLYSISEFTEIPETEIKHEEILKYMKSMIETKN